jgi:hypothetical protein
VTLARLLLRHATGVMPDSRRDWADGMAAELLIIDQPREALAFATGCVLTAYQQRISPMRIALAFGRFGTTAVTLLTAGVHAAFLLYWVAILNDLKTHGMTGWVGRFPVFRGMTAEQALAGVGLIPAWHVGALVAMTLAFALCAWMLAHRHFRALVATAGAGLAINTANALAMQATQGPYLVHHEIAWLYSLAFGLLILAALAFMLAERYLPAKAPATA